MNILKKIEDIIRVRDELCEAQKKIECLYGQLDGLASELILLINSNRVCTESERGVHRNTVKNVAVRLGLPLTDRREKWTDENKKLALKLRDEKVPQKDIAVATGMSKASVSKFFKNIDVAG